MPEFCADCRWLKTLTFSSNNGKTKDFDTCSNAKVMGKPFIHPEIGEAFPRVIFCEVERDYDSGCGIEGRYFQHKDDDQSVKLDLVNAQITWVERIGRGHKPR